MKEKVIDALVNGQSEAEISTGTFFQLFEKSNLFLEKFRFSEIKHKLQI